MDALRKAPAFLQCDGKERFSSPQVAMKVIRKWTASKRHRGKRLMRPLASYRCGHCSMFHIGGRGKP